MDKNDDGKISRAEFEVAVLKLAKEMNMYEEVAQVKQPVKRVTIPAAPKITPLAGDNALTFRDGLRDMGKTFNNARHAFLTLSINEKSLSNLDGIDSFKYLQNVYVAGNGLKDLKCLSVLKHLVRLDASENQITNMLDFEPPACLDWVDYSHNQISKIENVHLNPYLKELYFDDNQIEVIEGLKENPNLRVLSMNSNRIKVIQNLEGMYLSKLYLRQNHLKSITGLDNLPVLSTLDLSKNQIVKLRGLEQIESLRFLNLSLNQVYKVRQLRYIEQLPLLTELEFCFNPIMDKKLYRL